MLAYYNSLSGVFVFDDLPAIRDNPTIRTLWPLTTPLSPPANSGVGGRPLANLSFAINHAIGGTAVRGYHVGNLLLHLGSALLLFGILERTFREDGAWFAWAATLIWTVHPLATATVSYLSQRTELLMSFCYLLTVFAFVRGVRSNRVRWFVLSVIASALGMMSKEVMATAPVLVLLYDRTFVAGTFGAAWRQRRAYYLALGGTWLVLAALLTTDLAQRSVGFGLGVSAWQYALTEAHAIALYLKRAVWPTPLIFDYGRVYAHDIAGSIALGIGIALLLGWSVRALLRGSRAGFASVGFFLLLAPTSSFIPIVDQPIAENRAYLPLAIMCVGLTAGVRAVLGRRYVLALVPVALALSLSTMERNHIFRSGIDVWTDTALKRPQNPRAHFNRGVVLLDAGQAEAAIPSFERALQLDSNYAEAHDSLGNAWLQLERVPDAIAHYTEAVRLKPQYVRAWYNLGSALLRRGDAAAAIERLEECLRLAPNFAEAHNALGNAFFAQDDPAQAVPHYEHALRLDPELVDAHYNCGNALLALRRVDDALFHFAALVRAKPTDAEARNAYGAALLTAGRAADAIAQFEHALRLKSDYADARSNLDLARRTGGRSR
jgi:tetratricopeptide (TPR) repeat protein